MGKYIASETIFEVAIISINGESTYFATENEAKIFFKKNNSGGIFKRQAFKENGEYKIFREDLSSPRNRAIAAENYENDMWSRENIKDGIVIEVFVKYNDQSGDYSPWEMVMTGATTPVPVVLRNQKAIPIFVEKSVTLNTDFQNVIEVAPKKLSEPSPVFNIFSATVEIAKSKFFSGSRTEFFCTENEAALFIQKAYAKQSGKFASPQETTVFKNNDGLFMFEKGREINKPFFAVGEFPKNHLMEVFADFTVDNDICDFSTHKTSNCDMPAFIYVLENSKAYEVNIVEEPITINNDLMLEVEQKMREEAEKKIQAVMTQHIDLMEQLGQNRAEAVMPRSTTASFKK